MQHEIYQSIGLIPGIVGLLFRSLGSHAPTLGDLGLFLDCIPRNFLFVSILLSDCFLPLGLRVRNLRSTFRISASFFCQKPKIAPPTAIIATTTRTPASRRSDLAA